MGDKPIRVCVVSDTHLSPVYGFFYTNFRRTVDVVDGLKPDLIVNVGDLAVDGAGQDGDLAFAALCHRRFTRPLLVVPGNHDIGDHPANPDAPQPIDAERIERFGRHFGPGYWARSMGAWVLVGLDCFSLSSGTVKDEEQWGWLERILKDVGDRPVGLIIHKPLTLDGTQAEETPGLVLPPMLRRQIEAAFAQVDLRFVISGHLHQSLRRKLGDIEHIWAPSTAFMAENPLTEGSDPRLGLMMLTLSGREYELEILHPSGYDARDIATIKGHGKYQWLRDMPPAPPEAPELADMPPDRG